MAYAIIETGGLQFQVKDQEVLEVPRMSTPEGGSVTLDRVLLFVDGDQVRIGQPTIDGALVEAKVLKHTLGEKILVYKQKRRKNYRRKRGHRQPMTRLEITGLKSGL